MTECGCDPRLQGSSVPAEGWHWGGCSDHIQYGTWFSRKFIDNAVKNMSTSRGGYTLLAMNQHNTEAGRQVSTETELDSIHDVGLKPWLTRCLSGHRQDDGDRLSLSWRFWFLCREDLLEDDGPVRTCGPLPEGPVRAQRPSVGPFKEKDQEEGAAPPSGRQTPAHLLQQVS